MNIKNSTIQFRLKSLWWPLVSAGVLILCTTFNVANDASKFQKEFHEDTNTIIRNLEKIEKDEKQKGLASPPSLQSPKKPGL